VHFFLVQADAAKDSIDSLKATVQAELQPLVQRDADLRSKLQALTSERDALVAKVGDLSAQIRDMATERAANSRKRDAVASKHKGVAVDLDKQYRALQVAGARASAAKEISITAESLEHQLMASVADLGKGATSVPGASLRIARGDMLAAAAKHLTVEASVITRLHTRAESAAVEVGKLQLEAGTYRKMGMQNVLDGVLAKIEQLKEHSVEDRASAAALRAQAQDVLADITEQLTPLLSPSQPLLSPKEARDLKVVHAMANAAALVGAASLPPVPASASAPPGLPMAVAQATAPAAAAALATAAALPTAPKAATPAVTDADSGSPTVDQRQRKLHGVQQEVAAPGVPGMRGFGRGAAKPASLVAPAAGSGTSPVAAPVQAAPVSAAKASWAPPSAGWGKKPAAAKAAKSFSQIKAEASVDEAPPHHIASESKRQ
jgi:predicted  nucleic acid-binding Zn-ribbon protein